MEASRHTDIDRVFIFAELLEVVQQYPEYFVIIIGKILVKWAVFGQLEDQLYLTKRKGANNRNKRSLIEKYNTIINLLFKLEIISDDLDRCFIIAEKLKQTDKKSRLGICGPEFFEKNSGVFDLCAYGFCRKSDALAFIPVLRLRFPSESDLEIIPPKKGPLLEEERIIEDLKAQVAKLKGGSSVDMDWIDRVLSYNLGRAEINFDELFALIKKAGLDTEDPNLDIIETISYLMEELKRVDLITTEDLDKGFVVLDDGEVVNPRIFLELIALKRPSDVNKLKRFVIKRNGPDSSIRNIEAHRASKVFEVTNPQKKEAS